VNLNTTNATCNFATAAGYCVQSYVFTKSGCSFGGDLLELQTSYQCSGIIYTGLLTVSLIKQTCPSVDISVSSQDSNFQSSLLFYGTNSNYNAPQPGYGFQDWTTGVTFYYTFVVSTLSGLSISSYQIVSAKIGSVSVLGTTTSSNGQFSTSLVSAQSLGLAKGSNQVLSFNVTVSVTYAKRNIMGVITTKRALLTASMDASANQQIFFSVQNELLSYPQKSHATLPIASLFVWMFIVALCML